MDHGTALRVVLAQPLPAAGISMMRLQHESLTRAVWLLYSASDEQIDRLVAPLDAAAEKAASKLPMAQTMLDEIVGRSPHAAVEMFTHFKDVNVPALHSFVHGGIHVIQRGLKGYPVELARQRSAQLQRARHDDRHAARHPLGRRGHGQAHEQDPAALR